MSDVKFSLPGSGETYMLTGQIIDKLIRAGDGDAALLYLYILRTNGQKTASEAAVALDKSKGWVASAMAMLSRLGLVQLDEHQDAMHAADGDAAGAARAAGAASPDSRPPSEPKQYTEHEVKNEILSGSDFSIVVDETQRRLGKILSPDDLMRLYGIYDNLRLPPEVILLLITHCIKESSITGDGRAPSIRYIEKAAYTWEREGIFSLERAEEYLKGVEARKSARGEVKSVLHIKDREFSATEKRYVESWIEMGFEPGAIAIAYDKTIVKTGGLTWPYIDKIMSSWHNKGIHTADEIWNQEKGQKKKPQKHGEPNREDIERMQRLLDKTKEENEDNHRWH